LGTALVALPNHPDGEQNEEQTGNRMPLNTIEHRVATYT
jgi:hypothetical protein